MSRARFPSRRRWRSDLVPLAAVFLASWAVSGLIPRAAFLPESARGCAERPCANGSCAFVILNEADEAAAIEAARTTWQSEGRSMRQVAELRPATLPEDSPVPVAGRVCPFGRPVETRARPQMDLLPPTAAASAPARIRPEKEAAPAPLPFPREVLLRIE